MRYVPPLGKEEWKELMELLERGPTPRQVAIIEKALNTDFNEEDEEDD